MLTQSDSQDVDSVVPTSREQRPAEGELDAALLGSRLRRSALGAVAIYAGVAALLLILSDSILGALARGLASPIEISMARGIAFVAITGGLLHLLLRRTARRLERDVAAVLQQAADDRLRDEAFRQLAENIDDVFWFAHPDKLELFYVNPAYEAVWGYSGESLRATPSSWLASVHPDDRDHVMSGLSRYATGNWQDSFRIVRPDGGIRWIDARIYMTRDAAGRAYRVAGLSRDVTESRSLEEQLRQTQKMEPVGRLAGGIAHDFNNLLSVILSYTGLLLAQSKSDGPGASELGEIRRACERAAELTQQLLAFSRQQVMRPKVLDLVRIVLDMKRMLGRLLQEDIELALCLPTTCARVHADPSQIEQVLMNLAVNARDAMPTGGKLTIGLTEIELDDTCVDTHQGIDPGRYVMLSVSDTGVGMDAGTRARLFQPFFTTKAPGKGTGLGLSTVFGIVKQSRGHLHVQSQPGHGTTVKVYLPATTLIEDGTPMEQDMPMIPLLGWETVLLVEDDDQVRGAARAVLSRHGYRVLEARDGAEATEAAAGFTGEIHLLLTDTVMPGISGPTLAEQLASTRPLMKTLFMSGYTDDESIHRGVLTATVAFLAKPFAPELLLRHVRRTLSRPIV